MRLPKLPLLQPRLPIDRKILSTNHFNLSRTLQAPQLDGVYLARGSFCSNHAYSFYFCPLCNSRI